MLWFYEYLFYSSGLWFPILYIQSVISEVDWKIDLDKDKKWNITNYYIWVEIEL